MSDAVTQHHVVGIGASAGGLQAIQSFFERIPATTGLAFVVVQHLSPDFRSMMDELLGRHSALRVVQAQDGMELEPDRIHLIPPRANMTLEEGRLRLHDPDPNAIPNLPINIFFRSLAQQHRERAIAVVLSGTGRDGSRGILDVSEHGGLVLAQDPASARFDGMPRSAIDTRVVNRVLPPEQMGEYILRYVENACDLPLPTTGPGEFQGFEGPYAEVFKLVFDRYDLNLGWYKPNTVVRRIQRRAKALLVPGIDEYVAILRRDESELHALYRDLLIGVTAFQRDPEAFRLLEEQVVPQLFAQSSGYLKAWVCACSTGEEAYSIAMALQKHADRSAEPLQFKVFATDANRESIAIAAAGVYPASGVEQAFPEADVARFFTISGGQARVSQELRNRIVFNCQNVLSSAPFSRLDLLVCRNLLIYLAPEAQRRVISQFSFGLKPGGVLFLGSSETVGALEDELEPISTKWKLFRRVRGRRVQSGYEQLSQRASESHAFAAAAAATAPRLAPRSYATATAELADAALRRLVGHGFVVDDQNTVTHVFGSASRLLERFRDGRLTNDLLALVEPSLRSLFSAALSEVKANARRVAYRNLALPGLEEANGHDLEFEPVADARGQALGVVVRLRPSEQATVPAEPVRELRPDEQTSQLIAALEAELQRTRESLQASIEERETANEELQSTNEELLASNEELQSTNEELHSVNEELYTVNAEFQQKILELTQLNNDIDNLLKATDIATVFVNRDLSIRKFTPAAQRIVSVIDGDLGRPLQHFTHTVRGVDLVAVTQRAIAENTVLESDVRGLGEKWYRLRASPYHESGGVTGAVLTLVDITAVKQANEELVRAQSELTESNDRFRRVEEGTQAGIWERPDTRTDALYFSPTFYQLAGRAPGELEPALGALRALVHPEDLARFEQLFAGQGDADGRKVTAEFRLLARGAWRWFVGTGLASPLEGGGRRVTGSIIDVDEKRRTEEALKAEQAKVVHADRMASIGIMAAGVAHEINNPLTAVKASLAVLERLTERGEAEPGRVRELLERANRTVQRIVAIVDSLRGFARRAEQDQPVATPVDAIVRDTLDLTQRRILNLGIRLDVAPVDPQWRVVCRPVQISQVLLNLLTNAVDAVLEPTAERRITLAFEPRDGEFHFIVSDGGPGLPAGAREQLFEPFFTTKPLGKGTGLGLSLSRSIIENHGGRLELDASKAQTTFRFTLPRA